MKSKALKAQLEKLAEQVDLANTRLALIDRHATSRIGGMATQLGLNPDSALAHSGGFPSLGAGQPPPAWPDLTVIDRLESLDAKVMQLAKLLGEHDRRVGGPIAGSPPFVRCGIGSVSSCAFEVGHLGPHSWDSMLRDY